MGADWLVGGVEAEILDSEPAHDGECIERQKENCSSLLGPRCFWLLWVLQAMLGVEILAVDV
eukprot:8083950-Pyramimonas_sp.AAC.1